jgi:ABC-2 type transport system ATP-binding protein
MVRGFSGGMMQRLSIARAMMHDPASALSRRAQRRARSADAPDALGDHSRIQPSGKTIVLTTHNMEEADALCSAWPSSITVASSPRALRGAEGVDSRRISAALALRKALARSAAALQSLAGVREVRPAMEPDTDVYADRGGSLIPEIAASPPARRRRIACDVHISEPSLENLFLHHTGRSLRD